MNNLTPEERNRLQDALFVVHAAKLRKRNFHNLLFVIFLAILLASCLAFFAVQWGFIVF